MTLLQFTVDRLNGYLIFPKSLHKFDNGIYNLCVYWVLSLDTGALRLWSGRYSASKLSKSKKKEEI